MSSKLSKLFKWKVISKFFKPFYVKLWFLCLFYEFRKHNLLGFVFLHMFLSHDSYRIKFIFYVRFCSFLTTIHLILNLYICFVIWLLQKKCFIFTKIDRIRICFKFFKSIVRWLFTGNVFIANILVTIRPLGAKTGFVW